MRYRRDNGIPCGEVSPQEVEYIEVHGSPEEVEFSDSYKGEIGYLVSSGAVEV